MRIVYDRRKEKPGDGNERAVEAAGLAVNSKKRTENKSYISHNKFIVLIKNGEPLAVWTGGTNFSEGGIFGHSNVAHVVEDPAVARFYAAYWDLLADNPTNDELEPLVEALSPVPAAGNTAAMGTTVVFSPRPSLRALEWYRDLAMRARHGLFMTFAFGINDIFKEVYRTSAAPLRFALLEKKTRTFKRSEEQLRIAEERAIDRLRFDKANVFAIGSIVRDGALEGWVKERLTGLNKNVNYVHNKFMLIDPLSTQSDRHRRLGQFQQRLDDEQRREHARHQGQQTRRRHLSRRVHAPLQPSCFPGIGDVQKRDPAEIPAHG